MWKNTLMIALSLVVCACAPNSQQRAQQNCSEAQTVAHTVLKGIIIAKGGVFDGGC